MLLDFVLNILANLATAAILAGAALVLARRRRVRARRFFGMRSGREIRIVLSSITVTGSRTSSPLEVARGFRGEAIAEGEYKSAVELSSTVMGRSSSILTRAFLGEAANVERITAAITVSPLVDEHPNADDESAGAERGEVEELLHSGSCVVCIGGPIYNSVSRYILSGRGKAPADPDTRLTFVRRDDDSGGFSRGISLREGTEDSGIDEWTGGGHEYYMIEKVTRKSTTIFLCAGTNATATTAAVQELARWNELADAYPREDFARVYVFRPGRTGSSCLRSIP